MNKKIMIQVMSITGLIFCLLGSTLYGKSKTNNERPGTVIFVMSQTPEIITSTKVYSKQDETLALNMKIPQLTGFLDKRFEKQYNNDLLKSARLRKKEIITQAKAYNADTIEYGLKPLKFEYIESYAVIPSPSPYFTLEFFKYQYSGGAHGISELNYNTIDLNQSKVITLADLFKNHVDYKTIINEQINKQIAERTSQGEYFFTGSEGFVSIKDNQLFYINEEGALVIVFNVYEIAPYVAGAIEFPIDSSVLKPYLK